MYVKAFESSYYSPLLRAFCYAWTLPVTRDGHTIRSTAAETPMLLANITALCFLEQEIIANGSSRPDCESKDPCVDGSVHHLRHRLKQWIR